MHYPALLETHFTVSIKVREGTWNEAYQWCILHFDNEESWDWFSYTFYFKESTNDLVEFKLRFG